jgi:hypothetical protein
MRSLLLALLVLAAAPRLARADGWWKACDSDGDPSNGSDCGGCDSDGNPSNGTQCQCSGSDPAAVGTSLGLMGLVAWRIGRKRRTR